MAVPKLPGPCEAEEGRGGLDNVADKVLKKKLGHEKQAVRALL